MPLILASASQIRRAMLKDAGLGFETDPADINEAEVKNRSGDPASAAVALARAKALAVSERRPADLVIGSDSIVTCDGTMFDKPADRQQAEDHLRAFSGKTMTLVSAVALASGGTAGWDHVDSARLRVRPLSDAFIKAYLEDEWPAVAGCVGVFRMEGRGVQLFDAVDGSHFTILGMPLLPLLGALRDRGLLQS